jgi:ornithine cyclodeaminase/alanine dehydrogenase-like protein (mu-crystallin family)
MSLQAIPFSPEVRGSDESSPTQSGAARFVYLSQQAVLQADVLNMCHAMDVIAETLVLFEKGECRQPHKIVLRDGEDVSSEENGRINGLFASIRGQAPAIGMKWIASFPANRARGLPRASALIILNCPETGLPLAIMDGTLVSAMRTGAVTALGLRYLAPQASQKAAIIGAGVQAHTQILALVNALPGLEEIAVFNRTPERAGDLAEECRRRWHAPVVPVSSIAAALEDADVVIPCTTMHQPFIRAEHVKPGALTVQLSHHECDFEVVSQCQKIVVDNWDVVTHRGTVTPAIMHAQGLLPTENIYGTLGQLILGLKPGRQERNERIHFVHQGMGIEDVALAKHIYRTACERNLGQWLDFWEKPLWV